MTCPVVYEDKNNNFKRTKKFFFFLKDHSKAVMKLTSKANFKNFNLLKIDRLFWVALCFRPHFDYTGSYSKNCLNVKWESDVVSA